jgi:hypothetical protein
MEGYIKALNQFYNIFFLYLLLIVEYGFNIMDFILFYKLQLKACLGLINTLFLARIQGLFGSGYELFSLRFWGQFCKWAKLIL